MRLDTPSFRAMRKYSRPDWQPGTDYVREFTVGLNWYLNESAKVMLDYDHPGFADRIPVENWEENDEDVVFVQLQLEF